MEYKLKIRPHHGMCIAFFKGKGYSIEFTEHMKSMIEEFAKDPVVCITVQADEICTKCPNNVENICVTGEKAERYDKAVLNYCGISDGTVMKYSEFKKAVHERILELNKRDEICGDCQWNEFCRF